VREQGKGGSLNVKDRPAVTNGRVRIEIAVNAWPANLAARLKALGFTQEKKEGVVLTGTIDASKLDTLIEEAWVAEVTPA